MFKKTINCTTFVHLKNWKSFLKKTKFKVDNYNISKRLSGIIFIEKGISYSYSTLRRFFGIVKLFILKIFVDDFHFIFFYLKKNFNFKSIKP